MQVAPHVRGLTPYVLTLIGRAHVKRTRHRARRAARRRPPTRRQPVPEIPFDSATQLPEAAARHEPRRGLGRRRQLEGRHRHLHARNSAGGPAYGATASQVLLFDKTGKFLREIGKGLYAWSYAHAIRFDKDDNLWAIDKGSDMIVRSTPKAASTMVFGRKKEASDEAEPWTRVTPPRPPVNGQFRQPTDVAWDTEGNIYISDGYINSRVAKFTKDGDWVASSGEPRQRQARAAEHAAQHRQRRQGQHLRRRPRQPPHPGVRSEDATCSCARSRSTCRCRPTRSRGWARSRRRAAARRRRAAGAADGAGAPWAICITPRRAGTQYLYFVRRVPRPHLQADARRQGASACSGKSGHQPKQFGWIHEIACPSENEIYVAELLNWRVQKLTLKPAGAKSTTAGQ